MPIEECRVYDAKGNLKKTISKKKAQEHFWTIGFQEGPCINPLKPHRQKFVEHLTTNYVCTKCKKIFQATIERAYCYTPCQDPKEKTTRPDTKLDPVKCEMCKKEFQPHTRRHTHCNNPCKKLRKNRNRKKSTLHNLICKICKEPFKHVHRAHKYCNNPCNRYTAYRLKRNAIKLG